MRSPIWISALLAAANGAAAQSGRIVTYTSRARSLAKLLGTPAQARVSAYLPPSYVASPRARYPVLCLLHGFFSSDAEWSRRDVRGMMDSLITAEAAKEMIIVMPDASNSLGGTFYVNGAMYAVSSCCTPAGVKPGATPSVWDTIAATPSIAALERAGPFVMVTTALPAAFAPNASKPPFFFGPPEEQRSSHARDRDRTGNVGRS
jgi:hypothetical protein